MSQLTFAIIEAIPQVLQLVVAVLGLIYSIKGRPNGVSGQMVGAFVVLLVTTVLGLVWQFVSLNVNSWAESGHLSANDINSIFLGVDVPIGIGSALAWLLVALAVLRSGRQRQQSGPANYGGPTNYPMGPQPGIPQPGYAQPGYAQPGYTQPGYPEPGYQQPNPGLPPQG